VAGAIDSKIEIAEKDPQNSQVRFELGTRLFREGDYEQSIKWFKEYLALSPGDTQAMLQIGKAYQGLENHGEAIAGFKKILETEPDNKEVMCEVSRCYKDLGSFRSARTYAQKAIRVDNSYGLAWIALGEVYDACAERCVNQKDGKVDFNDKLVYELAAIQYRKALRDVVFKQEAQTHLNFLQGALPRQEDKFMHKDQKQAKGECYSWIY